MGLPGPVFMKYEQLPDMLEDWLVMLSPVCGRENDNDNTDMRNTQTMFADS